MSVLHRFISAKTDGGDATLVRPSDWNEDHIGGVKAGSDYWRLDSEFFSATTPWADGAITSTLNGTGSTANSGGDTSAAHPGVLALNTGTTSTGRAALSCSTALLPWAGGGVLRFGSIIRMRAAGANVLSDGTNRYTITSGFGSSTGIAPGFGHLFRYSDNIQSGNWEAASYTTTPGTDTNVDTGVTFAMDAWYKLEIEIDAAYTEVTFYINDALVHTETTAIETNQPQMLIVPLGVFKALGSSTRFVDIDAFWCDQILTTPR